MIKRGGEYMPKVTKDFDKAAYDKQFQKDHYYRLNVVLPKDMRQMIDAAVASSGMSKNAFIKAAIMEKMERDGMNDK